MNFAQPLQLPVTAVRVGDYFIDGRSTVRLVQIKPIYISAVIVNYQLMFKGLVPNLNHERGVVGSYVECSRIFEPTAVLACVLRGAETCCDSWG